MITSALIQDESRQVGHAADWTRRDDGINCARCGGLMVAEEHPDFPARRCVQCGEFIDPIILQNRRRFLPVGITRSVMLGLFLSCLTFAGIPSVILAGGHEVEGKVSGSHRMMEPLKTAGLEDKDRTVMTVELLPGATDTRHSRHNEVLYVLEGTGRLEMDGKSQVTLSAGTVTKLDAISRHVLRNTSRTKTLRVLVLSLQEKGQQHPFVANETGPASRFGNEPISKQQGSQPKAHQHDESLKIGLVF